MIEAGTTVPLMNANRSSGRHIEIYGATALPPGTYHTMVAEWTVDDVTASDDCSVNFTVYGSAVKAKVPRRKRDEAEAEAGGTGGSGGEAEAEGDGETEVVVYHYSVVGPSVVDLPPDYTSSVPANGASVYGYYHGISATYASGYPAGEDPANGLRYCCQNWTYSGYLPVDTDFIVDFEAESPNQICLITAPPPAEKATLFYKWTGSDGTESTDYAGTATVNPQAPNLTLTAHYRTHELVLDTSNGRDYLLPGEDLEDLITYEIQPELPSGVTADYVVETIATGPIHQTVRVTATLTTPSVPRVLVKTLDLSYWGVFDLQIKTFISVNNFNTGLSCVSDYSTPPEGPVYSVLYGGGDDRTFSMTFESYRTVQEIRLAPDTTYANPDNSQGYIEGSYFQNTGTSRVYQENSLGSDDRITQVAKDDSSLEDCDLKHCEEQGSINNTPTVSVNAVSSTVKEYVFEIKAKAGCLGVYGTVMPSIDYRFRLELDASNPDFTTWSLSGEQDQFPWYEMYLHVPVNGTTKTLHLFQPPFNAPVGLAGLLVYQTIAPADGIIEPL